MGSDAHPMCPSSLKVWSHVFQGTLPPGSCPAFGINRARKSSIAFISPSQWKDPFLSRFYVPCRQHPGYLRVSEAPNSLSNRITKISAKVYELLSYCKTIFRKSSLQSSYHNFLKFLGIFVISSPHPTKRLGSQSRLACFWLMFPMLSGVTGVRAHMLGPIDGVMTYGSHFYLVE